ncbi:MAG: hypothetical protein AABX10_02650 [Nanoarchaeota archaeon]
MKIKEFVIGFGNGQKEFGHTISIIVNSLLLTFVYFIGVGITSILAKASNKKFLTLSYDNSESYWTPLNLDKKEIKEYYKQF